MGIIRDLTCLALLARHRRPPSRDSVDNPGTVLGQTAEGRPIVLPQPTSQNASHAVVFGSSGAGKTILTAHALAAELRLTHADLAQSIILIDPKGDLVEALIAELADDHDLLARVHYLNPFGAGFPFNLRLMPLDGTPIEIRATQLADVVGLASTARGAASHLGIGARQRDVLEHLLLAALDTEVEGASVLWALDALVIPDGFARLKHATRSERARQFLGNANLGDELRASVLSRLRSALAATPALERMMAAPTAIDFSRLSAPGQVTLVDLGQPPGGLVSLQTFFANLIVRLALDHLLDRPSPWTGHHTRVVIDEAQVVVPVLEDVLERVLTTGRSRGISVVLLTQSLAPIIRDAPELLQIAMTNVPLKLIGRMSAQDAERLARELAVPPGVDASLGEIRSHTASLIASLPNRHFFALTPGSRARFESTPVDVLSQRHALGRAAGEIRALKTRYRVPADSPIPRLPEPAPQPRRRTTRRKGTGFG